MQVCEPLLPGAEAYWVFGDRVTLIATDADTDGEFFAAFIQSQFREGDRDMFMRHTHPNEQGYLVLRGRVGYELGDETGILTLGQQLVIPPGVPHKTWNAGPDVFHSLMIMRPGGAEGFYRSVGTPARIIKPTAFPDFTQSQYEELMAASQEWMVREYVPMTQLEV